MTSHVATLDFSGMSCPAPLVGAKRVIDDLDPGQTILFISDCPGTADDLASWARATGNEVVASEKRPDGKIAYTLRRGGSDKPAVTITLDVRGVTCPGPILEARKLLNGMSSGEVLLLISNCAGTADDLRAWARGGNLALEAVVDAGRGTHEFYLKKR